MKKENMLLYLCIILFGMAGIYLIFFANNTSKYNSQTTAHRTSVRTKSNTDGTHYYSVYYFYVDKTEYACESHNSGYPDESKNIVYYDSSNPEKCMTEYDKSSGKVGGIICLVATAVMFYFFIIKKPSNVDEGYHRHEEVDLERQYQFEQENVEKISGIVGKALLIYKRVILGIIIAILLVLTLIDTVIIKQTIISKDYPEVVAVCSNRKVESDSTVFDDYIYTFKDMQGREQEIVVGVSKNETPKYEIKIKYNENNPQDYYEETATMDKSGIIWYVVKIVAIILLLILFFNKRLLNKVGISALSNRN